MNKEEEENNIDNTSTPIKQSQNSPIDPQSNEVNNDINSNYLYDNVISPIGIKTQPSLKEQQAASLAFSQMMSSNAKNQTLPMDKEKLFETFLLFQNFINMNQQNTNNSTMLQQNNESNVNVQEKINQIELEHKNENNNIGNISERIKTESNINNENNNSNPIEKKIEEEDKKEEEQKPVKQTNNYDDIPIKPTSTNFMELVEKSLANDNTVYNNENISPVKKKIVKTAYHQKKKINISKPSKNDKKYTYYTDLLDENGHLNEEKVTKKNTEHSLLSPTASSKNEIKNKIMESNKIERTDKKSKTDVNTQEEKEEPKEEVEQKEPLKEEMKDVSKEQEPLEPENDNKEEEENNDKKEIDMDEEHIDSEPKENQLTPPTQINNNSIKTNNSNATSKDNSTISIKEQKIDQQIKQLNTEIVKFKGERQKIFKLKNEYERLHSKLQDDISNLELKKKEFEIYKENEMKKIQKDKKNLAQEIKSLNNLKQQNQTLTLASKKDKEQIENLKNQIAKIQNDYKLKENNNKIMIDKLKKEIEDLKREHNNHYDIGHVNVNSGLPSNQVRGRSTTQYQKIPKSKTSNKFGQNNISHNKKEEEEDIKDSNDITEKSKHTKPYIKNNTATPTTFSKQTNQKNIQKFKSSSIGPTSPQSSKPKPRPKISTNSSNTNYNIKKITSPLSQPKQSPINFDFSSNENYDFVLPDKYANTNPKNNEAQYTLLKSVTTNEGKQINLYTNNKREVIFPSGVRKEIYNDGYQIVYFTNGDLKQIFPDSKSVYYFNEAKTVQTTFPDGLQVFKFNNGQIEKHYPDGTKQISFPDGSLRYILNDGFEETHYADGTIQKIDKENVITLEHPDGLKEIKYPDGREECVYPDGEVREVHQEEQNEEEEENIIDEV